MTIEGGCLTAYSRRALLPTPTQRGCRENYYRGTPDFPILHCSSASGSRRMALCKAGPGSVPAGGVDSERGPRRGRGRERALSSVAQGAPQEHFLPPSVVGRSGRTPRALPPSVVGRSGREAFEGPSVVVPAVAKTIVQAIGATLPELDGSRLNDVAAPVRRSRHFPLAVFP